MKHDFWSDYLIVKKSRNGNGLFTKQDLKSGERIFKIKGVLMTSEESNAIGEVVASNTYRYDENFYISPTGELGDYVNHSCEPNVRIDKKGKHLFIYAIGYIPKNSEILFDYSTILAKDDIWTMRCNCGTAKCRGVIGRYCKLPKSIRLYYREKKIVPQYILDIDA